jgi:hypothetical protein
MVASQVSVATRKLEEMGIHRAFSWVGDCGVKKEQIGEQAQEHFNAKLLGASTAVVGVSAVWRLL